MATSFEIRSPSNSEEEMYAKIALYLDHGAGTVRLFGPEGERARFGVSDRPAFSELDR